MATLIAPSQSPPKTTTTVTNVESWYLESKVRLLLFDDSKLKKREGLEETLSLYTCR